MENKTTIIRGGRLLGSLEHVAASGDATEATSGPARHRQRRAEAQPSCKEGAGFKIHIFVKM